MCILELRKGGIKMALARSVEERKGRERLVPPFDGDYYLYLWF